jgi:hypothetical protein
VSEDLVVEDRLIRRLAGRQTLELYDKGHNSGAGPVRGLMEERTFDKYPGNWCIDRVEDFVEAQVVVLISQSSGLLSDTSLA